MRKRFIENMLPITAMALGSPDPLVLGAYPSPPVQQEPAKAWKKPAVHKRRLRIWHIDDLPAVSCEIGTPDERVNCICKSLATVMIECECERYLLPALPVLAEYWVATPEETYFALKQLKEYGYTAMVPGYNGDVTVTKLAC